MTEIYLTNYIGILHEAVYATDIIDPANTTHYMIGKLTQPAGDLIREVLSFQPFWFDSFQIGQIVITNSVAQGDPILFDPVNCYPWRFVFTVPVTDTDISEAAGVFTITPVITGERSSFTMRTDHGNSSENIRDHFVGCLITDYSESMLFATGMERLKASITYRGLRRVAPASDVSNPPIFPNSTSNRYKKDTNTVLTWDGDSMLPEIISFRWGVQIDFEDHPVDIVDQKYFEKITTGNAKPNFDFTIRRAGGTSKKIRDDFINLSTSGTRKEIVFRIYNSATEYRQVTLTDCVWNMVPNHTIDDQKVENIWIITGIAESMSLEFKDGLNKTTFYGIA